MNLEHARSRRLAALKHCNSDRLLVSPVHHAAEMRLPDEGTVASAILDELSTGLVAEKFATEAGWSRSRTMVNLFKVAKKTGIGIERRHGTMFVVWPDGYEERDKFLKQTSDCCPKSQRDRIQFA